MSHILDAQIDSDAALVEALRREDPDAADQLVERYGERLFRLAAGVAGTREDAEEATQVALMKAVRTIETFKGDSSFGGWLDRLAAGVAHRKLLRRPPKSETVALDDVLPPFDRAGRHFEPMNDWSGRIDGSGPQAVLRRVMTDAIDALPPDYRTALVLHDVEGMSDADIAEVLGVGPSAVRARVHRSRLFLRQRLSQHLDST
jgi:RNA polymerase sigma-70 factor (ECF subfamily)